MSDDLRSLARAVCEAAYLEGEFLLRSGRRARFYFDKYCFESDPQLLGRLAAALRSRVPPKTDLLAGLELGGVPVATALGLATGIPLVFVRKEAKAYGTRKLAEGAAVADRRVVVVEDVVTSGGQVVESTRALRERGAVVDHALCVLDREAGAADTLRAIGVELRPLLTLAAVKPWMPSERRASVGGSLTDG